MSHKSDRVVLTELLKFTEESYVQFVSTSNTLEKIYYFIDFMEVLKLIATPVVRSVSYPETFELLVMDNMYEEADSSNFRTLTSLRNNYIHQVLNRDMNRIIVTSYLPHTEEFVDDMIRGLKKLIDDDSKYDKYGTKLSTHYLLEQKKGVKGFNRYYSNNIIRRR